MLFREKRMKRKREPSPESTKPRPKKPTPRSKKPTPQPPSPILSPQPNVVAVGSSIYNIAFPRSLNVLPRVSILDCKSHTGWIEAPKLPVELHSFSSSVVDHKIYVAGLDHRLKKNSFQVFDTETRVWDSVSCGGEREEMMFTEKSFSIDGKFHVVTNEEVLAYDPKQGKWDMVGDGMGGIVCSHAYCVIGNVLYSVYEGVFKWYDTERRRWRDLLGLVGLHKISGRREAIRLADYGGKMMVLGISMGYGWFSELFHMEIIRYSFFGLKEALGFAPSWHLWLRYSSFLVLYPTGITSEVGLIYLALPVTTHQDV
ncbi:hypothetical protein HA466_0235350 [Hirschfeldia incana]|nr:hypothetical protein HA466_0235350 [Hirschfeldia incana]